MNTGNDIRTLWIGDIEPWMTEKHLEEIFNKVGRVISVKLIRSKETNVPLGYCFIEFQTHDIAEKILMNYNSQPIPGAQGTFRMNWGKNATNTGITKPIGIPASTGYDSNSYIGTMQNNITPGIIGMHPIQEFSVYVGELELGVNEQQLADHFRGKYPSVTGSKIITEPSSKLSKGYGFVKFSNSTEGQRAIHEMNGSIFKGKFIKVSQAVNRQIQQNSLGSVGVAGYSSQLGYDSQNGAGYGQQNGVDIYGQSLQAYSQYYPSQSQQTNSSYEYYPSSYHSYQQPSSMSQQQQSYYYQQQQQQQYQQQYYQQYQYSDSLYNGSYLQANQSQQQAIPQHSQSVYGSSYYQQQQPLSAQHPQAQNQQSAPIQSEPYFPQYGQPSNSKYSSNSTFQQQQQQLNVQQQVQQSTHQHLSQSAASSESVQQQIPMNSQQSQQSLQESHQGQLRQQPQQLKYQAQQQQQQQQLQQLQQLSQLKAAGNSTHQESPLEKQQDKIERQTSSIAHQTQSSASKRRDPQQQ